jgi:predicted TIM-barrel fold metal-dependent hydrolase
MRSKRKQSARRRAAVNAVDIHCHVFNAQDIPIRGFVELVVLESNGSILDPIVRIIEFVMRSGAPTASAEIQYLQSRSTYNRIKPFRLDKVKTVSEAVRLMWLSSPRDRRWVRRHLSPRARARLRGRRRFEITADDFNDAARRLIKSASFGTWIEFAWNYVDWRSNITKKLASLSKEQERDVVLYTPAMLDIGTRLGEPCRMSELADQIEVMRLISKLNHGSFATHCFVPFDPFRKGPMALDLVKDAIRNKGAIGVKIYPPMGFKPSDNDRSSGVAHHLNDRMKGLLDFCLKEDVPILAHCSYSQYVSKKEGACAAPEAWRVYLDQTGHKNLRLNLGHGGGPWDRDKNPETRTIWTKTVIEMLHCDKYPNLYADFADDSDIIDPDGQPNLDLMTALKSYLKNREKARKRLLYGSDWSLLARESGNTKYYANMKKYFCKRLNFSAEETRGYLGGNAMKFLGLVRDNGLKLPNRVRLERFRRSNGLDMSLFLNIDALMA